MLGSLSPEAIRLLIDILREDVSLELLQSRLSIRLAQEYGIARSEISRLVDFCKKENFLGEDAHGELYYTRIHFAVVLLQLEDYYSTQEPAHVALSMPHAEELFPNELFHASLYHLQKIVHILLRCKQHFLTRRSSRISFLQLMVHLWLSVFETLPALSGNTLPLLQLYFILRDNHIQFDAAYFHQQLTTSPYFLEVLHLFSYGVSSSPGVNFPFELLAFAKSIELAPVDTARLWLSVRDLMSFVGGYDEQIRERLSLLEADFQHTAQHLFLPVKGEESLFNLSLAGLSNNDDEEEGGEEETPLSQIAELCKEVSAQREEAAAIVSTIFVFIGVAGRGQRDAARALRYQFSQIEGWEYGASYYEWDVQKLLQTSLVELEARLLRYSQGCVYFYNFPTLSEDEGEMHETLHPFLSLLARHLGERMYIFDFAAPSYVAHYLPALESLPLWVIHFPAYTQAYLKHHFKQLGIMAEVDITTSVYTRLEDLYERAKPFFDRGVAADLFVYQLFAESLQNMSLRVKERYTLGGALLSSSITPEDLQSAFERILHL